MFTKIAIVVLVAVSVLLDGCATAPGTNLVTQPEIQKSVKTQLMGLALKDVPLYISQEMVQREAEHILRKEEITKEKEEAARISMKVLEKEFRNMGFKVIDTSCFECVSIAADIWYHKTSGVPFFLPSISGVALKLNVTFKNSPIIVTYPRAYFYHEGGWLYGWTDERIHKQAARWAIEDMLKRWGDLSRN